MLSVHEKYHGRPATTSTSLAAVDLPSAEPAAPACQAAASRACEAARADDSVERDVLSALRVGRHVLRQSARRDLGAAPHPPSRQALLLRAESLARVVPHERPTAKWVLSERLRLIDLTLHGADGPDQEGTWLRAEFDLLRALGYCAQAHASWREAADDDIIVRKLSAQVADWGVADIGIASWLGLRGQQRATLRDDMQAAQARLECATERLEAGLLAAGVNGLRLQSEP